MKFIELIWLLINQNQLLVEIYPKSCRFLMKLALGLINFNKFSVPQPHLSNFGRNWRLIVLTLGTRPCERRNCAAFLKNSRIVDLKPIDRHCGAEVHSACPLEVVAFVVTRRPTLTSRLISDRRAGHSDSHQFVRISRIENPLAAGNDTVTLAAHSGRMHTIRLIT
jgi:hypothetical protein